jgi:hypothetical protein
MNKTYIICDIPQKILAKALESVRAGRSYTIHLKTVFAPTRAAVIDPVTDLLGEEFDEEDALEPLYDGSPEGKPMDIPTEEIDNIVKGKPVTEAELREVRGKNGSN